MRDNARPFYVEGIKAKKAASLLFIGICERENAGGWENGRTTLQRLYACNLVREINSGNKLRAALASHLSIIRSFVVARA